MKIYLDTIGCRLNRAEIEKFAAEFRAAGHTLVSSAMDADLVVVNTCVVTSEAGSDSRQRIRQAAQLGSAKIIVTGCLSTLEGDAILRLPGVIRNVPNSGKDELVADILKEEGYSRESTPTGRQPVPGKRERTRAFIKAQDGCDNHCTFCITRIVRGKAHSVAESEVLSDIFTAIESEVKEVVLSGVQLGSWGADFDPPQTLTSLVKTILDSTPIPRLRLSSVEPWDLDAEFFRLWENPRLCRQLHLPMQSGSDEILKKMGRRNTSEEYENLVGQVRLVCPEIAITTDVLVGFPGEEEKHFIQTYDLIKRIRFATGHVFSFSPRPGTGADKLSDQIPTPVKKNRSRQIRELFSQLATEYQNHFLGKQLNVLWEKSEQDPNGDFQLEGWTDNYIRVIANNPVDLRNTISVVKIIVSESDHMLGQICEK